MTVEAIEVTRIDAQHRLRQSEILILEPKNPIGSAREFVRRRYTQAEERILYHISGDFYSWTGTHYRVIDQQGIRAVLWQFLEGAQAVNEYGELVPFNPTRYRVTDVLDALKAVVHLQRYHEPPFWIDGRDGYDPREIMACANGLLHLPTVTLHPATPHFFGLNSLPFAYDPDAKRPERWLQFLNEDLWPGDEESVSTLQELFGLMLVPDTSQQKIFLLVGPKRAGKGTIARILTALLGRDNVAGPTLASLGQNFGLSPLIGKTAAIISDARLGTRADQAVITERLLSISGEDTLTVDRKYRDPWTGQFAVRFLVLTNELPRISDASGALASRFVVLVLGNSFYGREDHGLTGKLMEELSGILNWSIEGWRRLQQRGYFIQPASSQEAISELEELGSPMGAFVKQKCVIGPEHSVSVDGLFLHWQNWCHDQGRTHAGTKQTFGRDLRAVVPGLRVTQPRSANQHRIYQGIDLKVDTR